LLARNLAHHFTDHHVRNAKPRPGSSSTVPKARISMAAAVSGLTTAEAQSAYLPNKHRRSRGPTGSRTPRAVHRGTRLPDRN
jgi:hypothetical protein